MAGGASGRAAFSALQRERSGAFAGFAFACRGNLPIVAPQHHPRPCIRFGLIEGAVSVKAVALRRSLTAAAVEPLAACRMIRSFAAHFVQDCFMARPQPVDRAAMGNGRRSGRFRQRWIERASPPRWGLVAAAHATRRMAVFNADHRHSLCDASDGSGLNVPLRGPHPLAGSPRNSSSTFAAISKDRRRAP